MRLSLLRVLVLSAIFPAFFFSLSLAQNNNANSGNQAQILTPKPLPAGQQIYNPESGFYTVVTQRNPGPKNPACPTCALNLNFQAMSPAYSDFVPLAGQPVNEYGRMSWHSLEPEQGKYDFSIIDNVLKPCPVVESTDLCLPNGVKFGFRIMALNPIVNLQTNVTTGADGYPVYSDSPSYLLKDSMGKAHGWLLSVDPSDVTKGHYFIPDWNDQFFIDRVWALLRALGEKYDHDPRIGVIDIGLYGSWGEWHIAGLPDSTDYRYGAIPYASSSAYYYINQQAYLANKGTAGAYAAGNGDAKNAIIWAHVHAFPDKQLVMLTDDGDSVCTAMHANTRFPVGLRRDSLGSLTGWNSQFPLDTNSSCTSAADQDTIANRWKTAPFITEPFGNGSSPTFPCQTFETDPKTGAYEISEQVPDFHIAAIKNGAFCTGTWDELTPTEQSVVQKAGLKAGYRYAPVSVSVQTVNKPSGKRTLEIVTNWKNSGVTPAYDNWVARFSLWTVTGDSAQPEDEVANFRSTVNLRQILPTGSFTYQDAFALNGDIPPGRYQLMLRIKDPEGYKLPMQLAIQGITEEGYYPLGVVVIPDTSSTKVEP